MSTAALNHEVDVLAVFGTDLYVGGGFQNAAGIQAADDIVRWGIGASSWSALGSNGPGTGAIQGWVYALAVSGSDFYVGGMFSEAAGLPEAANIAKWDIGTSTWSAMGSNGPGVGALTGYVRALTVSGMDLYVGGLFSNAAGHPEADNIAKWDIGTSTWSAVGSKGLGNGALSGYVAGLAPSGSVLYVGGKFTDAAGIATADYIAKWGLVSAVVRKPDGRIRLGTGAFVGNNVYNTTGAGQSRTGSATRGATITFGISIQNDGTAADRFKLKATGTAANAYTAKYFHGTTDSTAAVVAGTYQTPSLAPAATYLITAKVTVKSTAAVGSNVTRLVTITSVASSAKKDAVKLIGKRA